MNERNKIKEMPTRRKKKQEERKKNGKRVVAAFLKTLPPELYKHFLFPQFQFVSSF
jgi:hypothetical protein